jgi:hypothetical protein
VRYVTGISGNNPPAPAFEPRVPAARFALPDTQNSSSGLADWIAALAGIDPQNPNRPAPPAQDDALRGFYRDDLVQPWFVRGRR